MEIISKNEMPVSFQNATFLEKENELARAASMYDKLLKTAPSDLAVLSRLMIINRKLKKYSREIIYIDKAIKIHEQKYQQLKSKNLKVVSLSKKLNSLLGHTDKKGNNLLSIPEVVKLKKRKEIALKKIK